MALLDDLREMSDLISSLPPQPRAIMASHNVPLDKSYRQWNTQGQLLIWMNRGLIHDLPRRKAIAPSPVAMDLSALTGIPVIHA